MLLSSGSARRRITALSLGSVLFAWALEKAAIACAVCQSGVPAAALPAAASSSAIGIALDARAGTAWVSRFRVDERRLELFASYDFSSPSIGIDAGLPLLWRSVSAGGPGAEVVSLGDLETRFRYVAFRHHESGLSLFVGAKWPTAPVGLTGSGDFLPSALQPGCSAIAPFLGASAMWVRDDWVISGVGQILLPFSIREAPHPGDSIRLAATAEREILPWLATRASMSLRLETGGSLAADVPDPDSGGAVLYVTTEAVVRPHARFTGALGLSFPVVQGWFGQRRESPVVGVTAAVKL